MTGETVLVTRENHVTMLTLNRPEVLNAMNNALNTELRAALDDLRKDPDTRAIVITGAGERAFCAGRDLKEYAGMKTSAIDTWASRAGQSGIGGLAEMPKPVIAAINGLAIGGGLELALACDIRIAAENASFALMEIKRGFFPGGGATWRLAPLVGRGWAMEMILGGDTIDARTAERIGLVNRVVPAADLMKSARALAERIAGWSPAAVLLAKQAVNQAWAAYDASGANIGIALRALAETNEDRAAATQAFVDKKR